MRKTKFLLLPLAAALLCLSGCHKTCSCKLYDGTIKEYTSDEVDANGGSCSGMKYLLGYERPIYSVCNWE